MKKITLSEQLVISILNDWTFEHLKIEAPYIFLRPIKNADGNTEIVGEIVVYNTDK